ncbi:MAG: hypothetical protein A2V98_09105, partial [Planctomycetes bacterium RBG_16_64_12]
MSHEDARTAGPRAKRFRLTVGMLVGGLFVVAVAIAGRYYLLDESASADQPGRSLLHPTAARTRPADPSRTATAAPPSPSSPQPSPASAPASTQQGKIVASVNGDEITRNDLANECLRHYGAEVLESLVNKYLIQQECQRQNISVSQAEVSAEIKRMAERFSLPVEHWLEMLEQERGINPKQYASDIIWPMLALRKLAGPRLEVTQQELLEYFDAQYGEAVKAGMIVCEDRKTAEEVRAAAAADPDQFGALAKEKSVDGPSASLNGVIQPIRKHSGPPEIEQVAFQMRDGDVSPVIPVGGQYVILKREGIQPAVRVAFEQVKMGMLEALRDRKMRGVAGEIFRQLQDQAEIQNVWNDPAKRAQMPGIAAVVNGNKITLRELAEVCIERHGQEVLEGTINRRLLEQACRKQNITITDADLDREIARAASQALPLKPDGLPDVEKWLALVTRQQNISNEVYRSDAVWPSVALEKLVGDQVEVTDDDLRRGYEANYGPRVRCLAIVLDDLRRAQRVWDMARSNPTKEYFGDLAAQYSTDPSGKALRGEVPPIQQHGGQPILEKEAFSLQPGALSSIVQVGTDRYVILLCEGRTDPVHVDFATVRDEI